MKKYHVTFLMAGDTISTGKTYEAETEILALMIWRAEFPTSIFLHIISDDLHNYMFANKVKPIYFEPINDTK